MELVRHHNQNPLDLFNEDFFWGFKTPSAWVPAIDVTEDQEKYVIKADLPGLKKEDVKISLEEGILTIAGERKAEVEQNDKNYHRFERSYGRFVRQLNVGSFVDESRITANYKDGVLEIVAPKAEKAKARTIEIDVK